MVPSPPGDISLADLKVLSHMIKSHGGSSHDINTVCKNIETMKAGGLAKHAKPAKVNMETHLLT